MGTGADKSTSTRSCPWGHQRRREMQRRTRGGKESYPDTELGQTLEHSRDPEHLLTGMICSSKDTEELKWHVIWRGKKKRERN